MTVTSAPIGSSGQSLDGFAVDANVLQAFRESVVITGANSSTEIAPVHSTYGLTVTVASTVPQTVNVAVASTQIVSSIPFYVAQSSAPWIMSTAPIAITGTTQVFGTVSTQVVSSIPFYVSQSTSPWLVSTAPIALAGTSQVFGTVSTQIVSSVPLIVSQSTTPWLVSTAPIALAGTSQVFGTVSTQIVSSIPFFVAQSSAPWTINGGINISSQAAVSSSWPLSTTQVNVVSSLPIFVTQSSAPWSMVGTTTPNIVSSIPFLVAQSSAPWIFVETVSTSGGLSATTIALLANLNTTVIKAGPGQVYGMIGSNVGSSNVFVRILNASTAATAIASTGVAVLNFGMPISTSPYNSYDSGVAFGAGITIITQQQPYTATTSVAPTASTATVTILYK